MYKKPTDLGKGEDVNKKKITYGSYCTSCGQKKPPTKRVTTSYNTDEESGIQYPASSMLIQDDSTGTCPNCKNKGQDWSNADGDRHGMYNQDTDEGGMGKKHTGPKGCKCGDPKCKDPKCKKHKREVRTGYGAEENDTGEVGWQGSGSPYPKKKAIMSNLNSRLKLMLVKGKKVRAQRRRGRVLARQEMERRQRIIDQEKRAKIQAGETEFTPPGQIDVNEKKLYSGSRSIVNTPSRTLESLYPDLKARDQAKKLKEEMEAALHGTK